MSKSYDSCMKLNARALCIVEAKEMFDNEVVQDWFPEDTSLSVELVSNRMTFDDAEELFF